MYGPARALARLVRAVSRRLGRSGGTTAPGRLLLALSPRALRRMSARLDEGSVLVSATNGKTTTAAMLAAALERAGRPVVHNRAGSNMAWGVATALLDAGRAPGQVGLFEVDEAWLPSVAADVRPRLLLLANLFRDQLDRYGELDQLADRWAALLASEDAPRALVLNADDPLVADLGRDREGVTWFGIEDDSQALPELQHAADSKHCRNCGSPYHYEAVYLGHLGRYRCPGCGRERPRPQVAATTVRLEGMSGSQVELSTPQGELSVRLPAPGLYNVYNAVAAAATALELGVPLATVGEALGSFGGAFGRVETIPMGGRELSILLIKNPAGANEVLRTLTLEDGALDLWLALNDRIADGRDVSWIWDADFELLRGRVRRVMCSGTRAEEMAVRLKYASIDADIEVDRDLGRSLDAALASAAGPRLYALPTYTALIDLRDLLSPARAREAMVGMTDRAVIWHDVENGSYSADLPLWRGLAGEADGLILDLGAGTGRVARDLHANGHTVRALDSDAAVLAALQERSPEIAVYAADARHFELDERFALVLAPMQLVQILGGSAARVAMLECVHRHLLPGGSFAAALTDPYDAVAEEDRSPPYPDMIERGGWVFSSQPLWVREERGRVIVERRRQAVSPDGALEEELAPFALDLVSVDEFEAESRAAGLRPVIRHRVPETPDHIGGAVVVCRR